jgi:hypothetical protein
MDHLRLRLLNRLNGGQPDDAWGEFIDDAP